MRPDLAITGGTPVRSTRLPYGRQLIDDQDVQRVVDALRSDWLTGGPAIGEFEQALAERVGAAHVLAVNSGTAALHAAMFAIDIGSGDEVVVPAMTFVASSNCVLYQNGTPVFCDVDPATLLIDPASVAAQLTDRAKAVIAVDYAGQPCDYEALRAETAKTGTVVVTDGCHALGATATGIPVGSLAEVTAFSFHPVKHVTTGEGGAIATSNAGFAERARIFRSHGITTDHRQRENRSSWFYEMTALGYNYRMTDFQAALGLSQLAKLDSWLARRHAITRRYDEAFREFPQITRLATRKGVEHAHHLYVVLLNTETLQVGRREVFAALRAEGIGVNVHYIPVHLHPYYRERFGTGPGMYPHAEQAYERMISLPMHAGMTEGDVADVITAVAKVVTAYAA